MKVLKSKKGATITEMLAVILVVLMLSALVVTGVQLAVDTYARSVAASEAKILCSTLTSAIKNELRFAGSIQQGDPIKYFSPRQAADCSLVVSEGQLKLDTGTEIKNLVSSGSYTYGNQASLDILTYDPANGTFAVKLRILDASGKTLTTSEFQVKHLEEIV